MYKLDLCKLLKGHEGEIFYSTVCGEEILSKIVDNCVDCFPIVTRKGNTYTKDGRYSRDGECVFFPSKNQRDWNKWVKEQMPNAPKTFDEIPLVEKDYFTRPGNIPNFELNKIQKSALALIKIHQLIEIGYGGNVTEDEWKEWDPNTNAYTIEYQPNFGGNEEDKIYVECTSIFNHIAFHTEELANEFLSYPENVQLIKEFYMK